MECRAIGTLDGDRPTPVPVALKLNANVIREGPIDKVDDATGVDAEHHTRQSVENSNEPRFHDCPFELGLLEQRTFSTTIRVLS